MGDKRGTPAGAERRLFPAVLLLTVLLSAVWCALAGCGAGSPFKGEEEADRGYTKSQAMIVVATERNRYEQIYTGAIWDAALRDGRTFRTYLLDQVKEFLEDMRAMNLLAEEQGIAVTGAEQGRLQSLAARYYGGLTEADRAYTGATEEDVLTMYREYYLANKVVGALTSGIDLEVSDSEAKVISVRVIQISSRAAAEAVYRRLTLEGADFASLARETSEGEQIERLLGRGEMPKELEDAAFALREGEISSLIEADGWFYIVECLDDYDEEATQLRKARLYEQRRSQVIRQIYSRFESEDQVTFDGDFWQEIRFSEEDGTTTADFFSLYREEFGA